MNTRSDFQNKPAVILRADGNNTIGLGHIFRLQALANILKGSRPLVFVTSNTDDFIRAQLSDVCDEIITVPEFDYCPTAQKEPDAEMPFDMEGLIREGDIVVTDGYWFGTLYQQSVRQRGCKLVCIDDLAQWHFAADVVINHAPGISPELYKREPYTRLCLGTPYLILRPGFYAEPQRSLSPRNNKSVYVSLGGSDIYGFTLTVAAEVLPLADKVNVIVTSLYAAELKQALFDLQSQHPEKLQVHENIPPEAVIDILDASSHAVVTASTVALEAIARGIRPLIGYCTPNQQLIYRGCLREGVAEGLGDFNHPPVGVFAKYLSANGRVASVTANYSDNLKKAILNAGTDTL